MSGLVNPYLVDFLNSLEARYSVDNDTMGMAEWICRNTRLHRRPFSFDGYHFQQQIADDMHPNLSCIKISQVGLTETQIRKILGFLIRNRGTKGIFSFPDIKMFRRVSKARIKPLIDGEAVFNTIDDEDSVRAMDLYQLKESFLYVTASTEGDATSTDADIVFNDEVDLTDQKMLALFSSRLQNSVHKIKQGFSTPTHAGFGIEANYNVSDQHEYLVKCDGCNHWQLPMFNRQFITIPGLPDRINEFHEIDETLSLDLDLNVHPHCEQCHRPLDLSRADNREWVAKYPGRSARGYRVRPFTSNRLSVKYQIDQLIEYKRLDFIRGWYNTVQGESYNDANARLNPADIEACMSGSALTPLIAEGTPVFIGVDMGQTCHIVLLVPTPKGLPRAIHFETCHVDKLLDRVAELRKSYNIVNGATDRHPYTPTSNAVRDLSEKTIWPVEYRGTKTLNLVKDTDDEPTHWQADRTAMMDAIAKLVRLRQLPMEGYGSYKTVIKEHLQDMVRDEQPEKAAVWVKLTGNDHFFHALALGVVSMKMREMINFLSDADQRQVFGLIAVETSKNPNDSGLLHRRGKTSLVQLGLRG